MAELWNKFIFGFCKVNFACWNGEPNWLGWIIIGIGVLILLVIAVIILSILVGLERMLLEKFNLQ